MPYLAYQTDWGMSYPLAPSGFGAQILAQYADILPIAIQQEFILFPSGCLPRNLRLRQLEIEHQGGFLKIVYPFRGEGIKHESCLYEMQLNPKIISFQVMGERWVCD